MGIHRNVTIIFERNGNQLEACDPSLPAIFADLVRESGYEPDDSDSYWTVEDCNWYGFAKDIADVSALHPGITFEANVEDGDGSQAEFTARGGNGHLRWGEMVFPAFDEALMVPAAALAF